MHRSRKGGAGYGGKAYFQFLSWAWGPAGTGVEDRGGSDAELQRQVTYIR